MRHTMALLRCSCTTTAMSWMVIVLGFMSTLPQVFSQQGYCQNDLREARKRCKDSAISSYSCTMREPVCCWASSNHPHCYHPFTLAPQCRNISLVKRVNCGYPGITEDDCELRGCCYQEVKNRPHCFYPNSPKALSGIGCIQNASVLMEHPNVSPEDCFTKCPMGHTHCGFSLTKCYCGVYQSGMVDNNLCTRCPGNPNLQCGYDISDAVYVYKYIECPPGRHGLDCELQCQCYNNISMFNLCDRTGRCLSMTTTSTTMPDGSCCGRSNHVVKWT